MTFGTSKSASKAGKTFAALIVGAGLFLGAGVVAPVAAQAATPTAVAVAKASPKCVKATKKAKVAKQAYSKARRSGNVNTVTAAYTKWRKAVYNKQVACAAPTPSAEISVPSSPSGNPNDTRPSGWTRPADGSGLPGSNAVGVTVQGGCPVTVSKYEFRKRQYTDDPNIVSWSLSLRVQNYSKDAHTVRIVVTAVDASGKPFYDKWAGEMTPLWNSTTSLAPYIDGPTTLVFTPFNANPNVDGAKVTSLTVTCE